MRPSNVGFWQLQYWQYCLRPSAQFFVSPYDFKLTRFNCVIFSRRLHEEAAIQSQWWRVKWEDVNTHVRTMSMSRDSKVSALQFAVSSRFTLFQSKREGNRYNQAPHLTQDTNGKGTTSQLDITNKSQVAIPFPAGDHMALINRRARKHNKNKKELT